MINIPVLSAPAEPAQPNPNWWENFWNSIVNFFTSNGWNILKFFSILVIGILVIFILMFIVKKVLRARQVDPIAVRFVAGVLRFALLLVLVLILLASMGVEVTGFTTAVSAAILAVGMALKDSLSNLASGLILVGSHKYKTGDYIVVGSVEGSITEISFLFTTLKTPDGKQVTMPNSTMVNSQVTNIGANPLRRVEITLPIPYEADVELVHKIVLDSMHSNGKVYMDPAPLCKLKTFGDSSLNFFCYCWVDTEDYWDVYYYLMETIFNELKRFNISIPFNQIEMRERTDVVPNIVIGEHLPKRVEKKRVEKKKKMTFEDIEEGNLIQVAKDATKDAKKKRQTTKKEKAEKQPKAEEKPEKAESEKEPKK